MAGKVLPSGTVTFLFSDIEGSTELLQELGDAYADELLAHHRIMREAIAASGGVEVGTEGDAFFVAFERPADAVACAFRAQVALGSHPWQHRPIRVRMGLHTGDVRVVADDYVGLPVHVAARIASAGHGGQVLLSRTTRDIVGEQTPEGVSAVALGLHRLKDLREPLELFQLSHSQLHDTFRPLRTLSVLPNNLPTQLTTLVGRERELGEIRRLIQAHRVLTLTGAGGVGKTRLAIQVAAELASEYQDGVWFVDLSIVRDPAHVPAAFAAPLAVEESSDRTLIENVADALRTRMSLIVVDNCEHVVQPVAEAVQVLVLTCPGLRIVATSREPLGLSGEAVWRVPSLGVPDEGADEDALSTSDCVRLFVDRATLADATASISRDDLRAAGHICRRLDGIPLAIELAAGRVGVLSCTQIAERLDDRFRLLTGSSRTVLGRQQTLRALIDWSHDLLDERERVLLRRLSVFVGSFSLEGAETVCADDTLDVVDVLDALTGLVRKSLVVSGPDERYALLETVRQYAHEKLLDAGEAATVRTSHRDWCRSFVESPGVKQTGPAHIAWLDRVVVEYDNVRAALEWSIGERDAEPAFLMAGSLRRYWQARGSRTEGRVWLDRCLALSNERTRGRALALLEAGVLARTQFFSLDDAKELLRESLSIWRELGDQEFTAEALCMLGQATYAREPAAIAEARGYLEESLAICRARGDDYDAVVPLQSLATIAEREGRTQDAQAMLRDVVQALRGRGPDRRLAVVIHALAMHEAGLRNWGSARDHAEEAIAIAEAMSDTYLVGMVSTRLIEILANLGEIDRAREVFDLVDALIDTFEDVWDKGMITAHAGRAARLLDPTRARALFVESNRLCRQMEQPFGVAGTVSELCGFELAFGQTEVARAYFTELVALYEDLQMDAAAVGELAIIAYFAYLLGEIETARQLLHRSLRATHETSYPYGVALSADGLAMVAAAQQRWERAVVLFGASDAIHERIGQPHPGPDFHAEGVVQDQRQREYDRLVAEAEQTLGPRTFAEAWDAGRAMSIDEAVAYGLDDADDDG